MDMDYENIMPISDCQGQASVAGRFKYEISGPAYHSFVTSLLDDFDNQWMRIEDNLISAKKAILDKGGALLSFTGSEEGFKGFKTHSPSLVKLIKSRAEASPKEGIIYEFEPLQKGSNHPSPLAQTSSAVVGGNLGKASESFSGAFLVTASIINYSHLWPLVRDSGGAYGVSVSANPDGTVFAGSFRDPTPASTFGAFDAIPAFLQEMQPDPTEFASVRRHVLSSWDEMFRPNRLWDFGAKVELGLLDPEAVIRIRKEIQAAVPEDCKCDGDIWKKLLEQGIRATGGNLEQDA
jgi:Zn-dependent M16 (insulinase) family peptidase